MGRVCFKLVAYGRVECALFMARKEQAKYKGIAQDPLKFSGPLCVARHWSSSWTSWLPATGSSYHAALSWDYRGPLRITVTQSNQGKPVRNPVRGRYTRVCIGASMWTGRSAAPGCTGASTVNTNRNPFPGCLFGSFDLKFRVPPGGIPSLLANGVEMFLDGIILR